MSHAAPASIARIARYPVKGLTAQPLEQALLAPDQPIAGDRRFALAHGASAFDPEHPVYQKKAHFLTWVRNPRLAALHCSFDPSGTRITVADPEPETSDDGIDNADLTTAAGRAALEELVQRMLGEAETRGSVRVAEAPGVWFSDKQPPYISLQNVATMVDLGHHLGPTHGDAPADWRRFRANLLLDSFPAWSELGWIGKRLQIGEAVLEVAEVIGRCAATHVNPDTAELDEDILAALRRQYGHTQCGVYARVIKGGMIRLGDTASIIDA